MQSMQSKFNQSFNAFLNCRQAGGVFSVHFSNEESAGLLIDIICGTGFLSIVFWKNSFSAINLDMCHIYKE